jgi:hypothetical protein
MNKRILVQETNFVVAVLDFRFVQNNPFLHAQQDRHLVGLSTPSLFTPSEHLIRGCRVHAVFPGEGLN